MKSWSLVEKNYPFPVKSQTFEGTYPTAYIFRWLESTTRIKKIYEWFFPCSNFTRFPHNHLLKKKLPVSGLKSGFWRSKVWSSHLRVCYHTKCLNEKPIREPVRPLHIKVIEYKSCPELFLNIIAMQNRYTWAEKYS